MASVPPVEAPMATTAEERTRGLTGGGGGAAGSEAVGRRATDWRGTPFAATNLEFDGAVSYNPNFVLQLGWMWRDPSRRLSEARLFAQYYTGHSPYGQFFLNREDWFGFGAALDY